MTTMEITASKSANVSTNVSTNMCTHCSKIYVRKCDLAKHVIICDVLCKNKRSHTLLTEECESILTIKQLSTIVQDLSFKYSKMEEKLAHMQKWVEKQKKKINIINWLNENNIPINTFNKGLKESISNQVGQQHIESLIKFNLIETVQNIFENNPVIIDCTSANTCSPIFCFEQKNNVFYGFKDIAGVCATNNNLSATNNDTNTNVIKTAEWSIISREELISLLNFIHSKLLRELIAWKKIHEYAVANDDKMSNIYNKTMIKLMEIDFATDHVLSKVKTALFNFLKKDLKNMIEYEFE